MENKTISLVIILSDILIISCFIAQSSALIKTHGNTFFGLHNKDKKAMSNAEKSVFRANELVFDMENTLNSQKGQKEKDRIAELPGQPGSVDFEQYGGYVTVDQKSDRALYYYFAEANHHSANELPLLLWLNGGPIGCSSLAYGAMQEVGPFRVKSDGKTLFLNDYAWNKAANVLFLESPAGVGFSYSNTATTTVLSGGDKETSEDNYVFLVNWLNIFSEYKNRDLYIAGENYGGHYVPQLAHTILQHNDDAKANNNSNNVILNLKGIIIGNAMINQVTDNRGQWEYLVSHAVISKDLHKQASNYCNGTHKINNLTKADQCNKTMNQVYEAIEGIDLYNIYAPTCLNPNLTDIKPKETSILDPDPCSDNYVYVYLNNADVQKALHAIANITNYTFDYYPCSNHNWTDSPHNVLPLLKEILSKYRLPVWIISGDMDGVVTVTSTQLSIKEMKLPIKTMWRPWYLNGQEVGGYTQEYEGGLTFATVRGAGQEVPTYQPDRALTLIRSFLAGQMLPQKHVHH